MIFTKKNIIWAAIIVAIIVTAAVFFFSLKPVSATANRAPVIFQITQGQGLRGIAQALYDAHLLHSPISFELFALFAGRASELRPGLYRLSPSMSTPQIVAAVSVGTAGKATVTIPEGSNIYDVDRILSNALVIQPGAVLKLVNATSTANASSSSSNPLEGRLFPDTYQFYTNSSAEAVVQEMTTDFNAKAGPLLTADPANAERTLIIASILEEEVPDQADQELVAGIIVKRLAMGIPLDIDATVCYAKFQEDPALANQACSLSALDFKIDSPYNTYLYKGLPPGPIGNPGTSAITAALHPQSSPYLYYLSDPKTGKTIFAKTLDEQNRNKVKYLESN